MGDYVFRNEWEQREDSLAGIAGSHSTWVNGLCLFHHVERLGLGVPEEIAALILRYASQVSIAADQLPPVTLEGQRWDEPWETIHALTPCRGEAGPSTHLTALTLSLPKDTRSPVARDDWHPMTVEGLVAHELVHLRWGRLGHGPEFTARVLALLSGAQFPLRGPWPAKTCTLLSEARHASTSRLKALLDQ
jgi:hypothetical protein